MFKNYNFAVSNTNSFFSKAEMRVLKLTALTGYKHSKRMIH